MPKSKQICRSCVEEAVLEHNVVGSDFGDILISRPHLFRGMKSLQSLIFRVFSTFKRFVWHKCVAKNGYIFCGHLIAEQNSANRATIQYSHSSFLRRLCLIGTISVNIFMFSRNRVSLKCSACNRQQYRFICIAIIRGAFSRTNECPYRSHDFNSRRLYLRLSFYFSSSAFSLPSLRRLFRGRTRNINLKNNFLCNFYMSNFHWKEISFIIALWNITDK